MTAPNSSATIPRIFVSHSRKDNLFCRPFVAHLRTALGLTDPAHIFYDETSIHISDDWLDLIQREVLARPIFLLVLTPRSVTAEYVKLETKIALRQTIEHRDTRRLISLLAEDCDPNELAPALLNYQMADFAHKPYDIAFADLVQALRSLSAPVDPAIDPPIWVHGVQVSTPPTVDPQAARLESAMQRLRDASQARDWHLVFDIADNLQADMSAEQLPVEFFRLLGQAQFQRHNYVAAQAAFTTALQRERDDVPTLTQAAQAAMAAGDPTNAALWLKRALGLPLQPAERLDILRLYLPLLRDQAQWEELLWRCDELSRVASDDPFVLGLRLAALTHLKREADALALARTLTARPDATAEWWLARAHLAKSVAHDDNEVRQCLDAADRLAPHNPALAQARRDLLPPPLPPITPEHFPQRLASLGFVGNTALVKGKTVEYITPPLCSVPAGPFLMGDDNQSVTLPAYQIARYPVTVAEYACFVRAGHAQPQQGGYKLITWKQQLQRLDHPVVCVSWHEAVAYAAWLTERTNQPWRLPSEEEWEKAALGTGGRAYPWGNQFDERRANTSEGGVGGTTPIGSYAEGGSLVLPNGARHPTQSGASPYGVEDLAGNVWEWTTSSYDNSTENRVLRGGSWDDLARIARATYRLYDRPDNFNDNIGFRLVVVASDDSTSAGQQT